MPPLLAIASHCFSHYFVCRFWAYTKVKEVRMHGTPRRTTRSRDHVPLPVCLCWVLTRLCWLLTCLQGCVGIRNNYNEIIITCLPLVSSWLLTCLPLVSSWLHLVVARTDTLDSKCIRRPNLPVPETSDVPGSGDYTRRVNLQPSPAPSPAQQRSPVLTSALSSLFVA